MRTSREMSGLSAKGCRRCASRCLFSIFLASLTFLFFVNRYFSESDDDIIFTKVEKEEPDPTEVIFVAETKPKTNRKGNPSLLVKIPSLGKIFFFSHTLFKY